MIISIDSFTYKNFIGLHRRVDHGRSLSQTTVLMLLTVVVSFKGTTENKCTFFDILPPCPLQILDPLQPSSMAMPKIESAPPKTHKTVPIMHFFDILPPAKNRISTAQKPLHTNFQARKPKNNDVINFFRFCTRVHCLH